MYHRLVLFWKILYWTSAVARTITDVEVEQRKLQIGDAILHPSFTWASPFSLYVIFPDGKDDYINLQPVQMAGKPIECLFRGKFYRDSSASAVISGCMEDHTVTITIISKDLWGRTAFEVNEGLVEELENPYANNVYFEFDDDELDRGKRSIYEDYEDYDYEEVVFDSAHDDNFTVPHLLTTPVKLAFDRSLKKKLGTEKAAKAYVRSVAEHGSLYLQNFSPETKIFLNFMDEIEFIDETLTPRAVDLRKAFEIKQPQAVPLIIFCSTDDSNDYMGVSPGVPGKACEPKKGVSIMKHREKKNVASMTFAHELGHIHGMRHDHRENVSCHGTGLMSEVRPDLSPGERPPTFSTCSMARFSKWFRGYGVNCMEEGIINKDDKLNYLNEKCTSLTASSGDFLQSGCKKPGEIKDGAWMCSEDGSICHATCNPAYKLIPSNKNIFIECFQGIWIENFNNVLCEIDPLYKPPVSYRVSSSDVANQIRRNQIGDYFRTGGNVNNFPIFRKGKNYLYADDGGLWTIGPNAEENNGWIYNPQKNLEAPPLTGWEYLNEDNIWTKGIGLAVNNFSPTHGRRIVSYRVSSSGEANQFRRNQMGD